MQEKIFVQHLAFQFSSGNSIYFILKTIGSNCRNWNSTRTWSTWSFRRHQGGGCCGQKGDVGCLESMSPWPTLEVTYVVSKHVNNLLCLSAQELSLVLESSQPHAGQARNAEELMPWEQSSSKKDWGSMDKTSCFLSLSGTVPRSVPCSLSEGSQ